MNGITDPQCPFSADSGITVDHVLWDCTETAQRDDDDSRNIDKRSRRNEKDHRKNKK
jgi:hypothetical protein